MIAIILLAATIADEPMRTYIEEKTNASLKGYTLHIEKLNLHPLTLSLDLENVTLIQHRHPDPPMAHIPKWHAGLQWTGLLTGQVVSDHRIDRPSASLTRPQAKAELHDARPSAWQDVVRQIFPLRINTVTVTDAEVTYYDHHKAKPVTLSHVQVEARDIINRGGEEEAYPSSISVDARLPQGGHITVKGHTNLLTRPFPAINVDFELDNIALIDFIGLAGGYNLRLDRGRLAGNGHADIAPWRQVADISDIRLEGVKADYVYRRRPNDDARRAEAAAVAKKAKDDPLLVINIQRGKVLESEFGFVNQAASRDYRIFAADVNADLDNFTTRLRDLQGGDAVVKVTGRFMGTGRSVIAGTFRPEKPTPDFDLDVQIIKTDMKSLNDVLRAYADFDVQRGNLSFFSELSIRQGEVSGYLKPIFRDVEVYDPHQDEDKAWSKKVYELVIGDVVDLLKNAKTDQVAADGAVTGPLPNPSADTWQVVGTLIQNAFFKAILPGLEKEHGKA
ncbi:MAG: DUF748 domain-containing protein [Nitrospira sp.]|nr:DUF748 domain-containing protein [Nitrospira sp.]